ncbi:MAG: glycosyltransferase family 4 protein, partial [Nitrospinaceae bacterium]
MKISFLCFDLSNNSLGRAALLAGALAKHHEVEIIGPARSKDVWFPLKDLELPIKVFPWKRYPAFVPQIKKILGAIDGDVIFACKLFPTSYGIGLLKRLGSGKPLLVDIDDWELGFFYHSGFWGTLGRSLNFSNPNGLPYVWLMERLAGLADGVSVSNRFLEKRFGGKLLHHCRDTSVLDPEKFDPQKEKEKLGLAGRKVVMFLGTPRAHKGIEDLFAALEKISDPDIRLVIIGAEDPLESLGKKWTAVKDRVVVLPKIPFSRLPDHLAAADVLAVPQMDTSDSIGQMPAKIFDAMA